MRDRAQDEGLALLEQAQDYYRAATTAAVAAAKPVVLYYSYLNTAKAFLLHRGRRVSYEKAFHGLAERVGPGGRELLDAYLEAYPSQVGTANVFDDLLTELSGAGLTANRKFDLPRVMPQIVPGHRLWVAASASALLP
jgi:hypothetical protein